MSFRLVDTCSFGIQAETYCFRADKTAPEINGLRPVYSLTDTNNFRNVFGRPETTLFECSQLVA